MNFIREFNETLGMTIIMVTHERTLAERYASRMIFLADGKLVGDQSNVLSSISGQVRGGGL
jgi:energy-coupling factor transporter ATP-binding protein EcfA2